MGLDPLQIFAVVLIVAVFFVALSGIKKNEGLLAQLASIAPNTLTTLGILFTFIGILLALRAFDVSNINDSIPTLLGGLKLAFLSSVVGLGASIAFRLIQAGRSRNQSAGEVGAADLRDQLRDLNANTLAVRDALIGEGDASLSTQFGKMRNDFRDFASKITEDGTQALVKALEEVVRDFNEKISEQFGDNFKQLNEAVGALLEWQKEHKAQVEILTQAFKEAQSGIEKIEETTAKIPEHMASIESAFTATRTLVEQLYEGIGSLSAMREAAEKAVPELQASIQGMTTGMRESVDAQLEAVRSQMTEMKDAQSQNTREIRELTANLGQIIQASLDETNAGIASAHTHLEKLVEESLGQTEKILTAQMEKFEGALNSMTTGMRESVDAQLEAVRSQMTEMKDAQSQNTREIRELTANLGQIIQASLDETNAGIASAHTHLEKLVEESLGQTEKILTAQMKKFEGVLDSLNTGADTVVKSTESVAGRVHEIQAQVAQSVAQNTKALSESFRQFDRNMQEELQRALTTMGNNLTSISKHLVDEYQKATQEMVRLNKAARR